MVELWGSDCAVKFRHDPHVYMVTSGNGTIVWLIKCSGDARQIGGISG